MNNFPLLYCVLTYFFCVAIALRWLFVFGVNWFCFTVGCLFLGILALYRQF